MQLTGESVERSVHRFVTWTLHFKHKASQGFCAEIMPSQIKRGKKKADFIVLKRGLTFCPLLLLFQKASYLFKACKATAGYLQQLMTGTELGGQIRWWEGRGSLGKEENCHYWPSKVIRHTQLWTTSVLSYKPRAWGSVCLCQLSVASVQRRPSRYHRELVHGYFPHRHFHGASEASCFCQLASALQRHIRSCGYLRFTDVKLLWKVSQEALVLSCAHLWCTDIHLLSLFTTNLSTANLIPARLWSQLPCEPSSADKQQH